MAMSLLPTFLPTLYIRKFSVHTCMTSVIDTSKTSTQRHLFTDDHRRTIAVNVDVVAGIVARSIVVLGCCVRHNAFAHRCVASETVQIQQQAATWCATSISTESRTESIVHESNPQPYPHANAGYDDIRISTASSKFVCSSLKLKLHYSICWGNLS